MGSFTRRGSKYREIVLFGFADKDVDVDQIQQPAASISFQRFQTSQIYLPQWQR